eukprot:scaffold212_cov384-Pavlova_lutheri.AAC.4
MPTLQTCTPLSCSTSGLVPIDAKDSPSFRGAIPTNARHMLRVDRTILHMLPGELRIPPAKQSKANKHRKVQGHQKMTRNMFIHTRLALVHIVFIMVHVILVMCASRQSNFPKGMPHGSSYAQYIKRSPWKARMGSLLS